MKTKIIYQLDEYGFVILESEKQVYSDMRTGEFCNYDSFENNAPDLPELTENKGAKLVNGKWKVLPDYRNKRFWNKTTKEEYKIEEPGIVPDFTIYTDKDPTEARQILGAYSIKFDDGIDYWIVDKEAHQKAKDVQRIEEIEKRLDVIDIRRLRPMEELAADPQSEGAKVALAKLDQEKADLKKEIRNITVKIK